MSINAQPLSFYCNKNSKPLIINLLNVGEGLMVLMVFPDETTVLFDCNVTDNNQEDILEQLDNYIPKKFDADELDFKKYIDIFINSHRDDDHLRGLRKINQLFEIKSIWDSGQSGATTLSKTYQYYMQLRRNIMSKYGNDRVVIPRQSKYPILSIGGVDIYCLNSGLNNNINSHLDHFINYNEYRMQLESDLIKEAKIQHSNSLVFSIKYANRTIMLTGDSDWSAWKSNIVPHYSNTNLLNTDILIASHHGSRSFFTDESINDTIDPIKNPSSTFLESMNYLEPSITLIPCDKYNVSHHPNKEALSIYKNHTFNRQVYTTNNKGHLLGFIDNNGNWTVCPSRFVNRSNVTRRVMINCTYIYDSKKYEGKSGDYFPVGSKITFILSSNWGAFDPFSDIKVWFEVSNGGIEDDHKYQTIYYKKKDEGGSILKFSREVRYVGKHLLRFRLQNKTKKIYITEVFIVNGVNQ